MIRGIDPKTTEEYELARSLMDRGLQRLGLLNDRPLIQAKVMNASGEFARDFLMFELADSLHHAAWDRQREAGLPPDHPDVIESINGLGRVFLKKGAFDQAEKWFEEAIALNPAVPESYNNLGAVRINQGKLDAAIDLFLRVVEMDPSNVKATNNLGVVYFYLQKWDEARTWYERALSLAPTYEIYVNLGTLYYYHEGRYADAAKMYEEALRLNDKDFAVWGNLANAYLNLPGEASRAIETFHIAIEKAEKRLREVNADDPDVISDLATYYAIVGEREKSIQYALRAHDLAPDDGKVSMRAGYVYEQIGERDRAVEWILRAIEAGYPLANIEREPGFVRLREDPRYVAYFASSNSDRSSE